MQSVKNYLGTALLLAALSSAAVAGEHPMGADKYIQGMEIGSVYLEPITMDKQIGLPANQASVHLELDIHATKDNKNTFQEGWWIPYLTVSYVLTNETTGASLSGYLMPMIADDGPHYGSNVKLPGVGNYKITYKVLPPSMNTQVVFGRHIKGESKAPAWFKPFSASWTFYWNGKTNEL